MQLSLPLAGIGESRRDRLHDLLSIRGLHRRYGHIQEVIVQNFRAKKGTAMAGAPEPPLSELLWSVAAARLLLGPGVSIQAPPNLTPEPDDSAPTPAGGDTEAGWRLLIDAGINDFGVGGWARSWVRLSPKAQLAAHTGFQSGAACASTCTHAETKHTRMHTHTLDHSWLCPGLCLMLTLRRRLLLCYGSPACRAFRRSLVTL